MVGLRREGKGVGLNHPMLRVFNFSPFPPFRMPTIQTKLDEGYNVYDVVLCGLDQLNFYFKLSQDHYI